MVKVLYLFAGERRKVEQNWKAGNGPDTLLIGLNHLAELGVEAEYAENSFINKIRKINFNLTNVFFLSKIRKYDIVFTGASLLIVFLAKVILRMKKPKFVFYNTYLTNIVKRNSGLKKKLIIMTIKAIDIIVCPSKVQYEFLLSLGIDESKLKLILTGTDVDFIEKNLTNIKVENKEKYILAVGKDMGRDYKTLVKAVGKLSVKVKVVAMSRNYEHLKNIPDNVEFIDRLPYDQVLKLYKGAKLVILPTKKESWLGCSDCSGHLSLLDAMACGKPIVATKRQTINNYVKDRQEVLLTEPENSESLRQTVEKLLADEDLREKLGRRAKERVKRDLTTKIMARSLSEVFKAIKN